MKDRAVTMFRQVADKAKDGPITRQHLAWGVTGLFVPGGWIVPAVIWAVRRYELHDGFADYMREVHFILHEALPVPHCTKLNKRIA